MDNEIHKTTELLSLMFIPRQKYLTCICEIDLAGFFASRDVIFPRVRRERRTNLHQSKCWKTTLKTICNDSLMGTNSNLQMWLITNKKCFLRDNDISLFSFQDSTLSQGFCQTYFPSLHQSSSKFQWYE